MRDRERERGVSWERERERRGVGRRRWPPDDMSEPIVKPLIYLAKKQNCWCVCVCVWYMAHGIARERWACRAFCVCNCNACWGRQKTKCGWKTINAVVGVVVVVGVAAAANNKQIYLIARNILTHTHSTLYTHTPIQAHELCARIWKWDNFFSVIASVADAVAVTVAVAVAVDVASRSLEFI